MKRIFFTIIGLFLLACGFLTPSRPNDETVLVGRHPEQWMPSYKTFVAINNNAPFTGKFAYPNEKQGITSYGFSWIEPDCSKAFSSSVYAGEVYFVLYKSISDVQSKIPNIEQYYKDLDGFQKNEVVNLRTGNTATISFYQITSCETTNHWATIMFRRNNVLGFANAQTYQKNSDDILRDIVSDLGSQLDQVIQSEISNHPGSESDIVKVIKSARKIELPSDTSQSTNDSENDPGSFGTDDTSAEECIHSIYAPTYKMCDEEYQFLQGQDP